MTTHRLVLLRHAKAEHGLSLPDRDRPLALRGRRQSAQVGTDLVAAGVVPDLVLCSSALRTRQTWDLLHATLHADPELVVSDDLYGAGVDDVLDAVRTVDEATGTVLVVGHEPVMSATAAALAGLGSDEATYARVRAGVPTGAWTLLTPTGSWSQLARGGARLVRMVVPA